MALAENYSKHIFCIEGNWDEDLKKSNTISDALNMLLHNNQVKHIHRHCSTKEEFLSRLKQFYKSSYKNYSILYLAFHGEPNGIHVGRKQFIELDEIAENCKGKLKNRIVHIGSCKSLKISKTQIDNFLETTEALCISGFTKNVDFTPSTVFEILYFEMCQEYRKLRDLENSMNKKYSGFCKDLGFKIFHN